MTARHLVPLVRRRGVASLIPGRRGRRQSRAALAALLISGLVLATLAVVGLGAWWLRRRGEAAHVPGHTLEDAAFDATALNRAAGEGMAAEPVPDTGDAPVASNGAGREPVASGGLVRLV